MHVLGRLTILFLALLAVGIAAPQALQSRAEAEDGQLQTYRFSQDDFQRRYKLYTPKNASALEGTRPLVLVIHGGGSTDRGMIRLTKTRWHTLADQHGFYVAYPNAAVDKTWDFGEGKISDELDERVDDLEYFNRVIDHVSARAQIDQNRVFATGISRGGQASYFLACNLSHRVRAVMPVAMGLPEFMIDECEASPPVAIAIMNGTADPQVPFEGGEITVFRKKRGVVLSAKESIALWSRKNGCLGTAAGTQDFDREGDETFVKATSWSDCLSAPVTFFEVVNGGHTWPGGRQYLSPRIVGYTSYDIDAADEAWRFFSQF